MIRSKEYEVNDINNVYDFLYHNYSINRQNGIEASLFNYLVCNYDYSLSKIWYIDEKIVGLVSVFKQINELYISFNNELDNDQVIKEMIEYACFIKDKYNIEFQVFSNQTKLKQLLKEYPLTKVESWKFYSTFYSDYHKSCNLPKGFKLLNTSIDYDKLKELIYNGFDQVLVNDNGLELTLNNPRYPNMDVIIVKDDGTYVGYGGVWLEKENKLAFLEPLCVLPDYRGLGIGSFIINEIINITKPLGIDKMSGGVSDFYNSIGFDSYYRIEVYE